MKERELSRLIVQRDDLLICLKWMVALYEARCASENILTQGVEYCASLNAIKKAEEAAI